MKPVNLRLEVSFFFSGLHRSCFFARLLVYTPRRRQNHGGQQDLGRGEDDRDHVQLHARVVQPHRVQAHPSGVRVGQGAQGRYRGSAGVRADALREGATVGFVGPLNLFFALILCEWCKFAYFAPKLSF